jgi:hypothetical protein
MGFVRPASSRRLSVRATVALDAAWILIEVLHINESVKESGPWFA